MSESRREEIGESRRQRDRGRRRRREKSSTDIKFAITIVTVNHLSCVCLLVHIFLNSIQDIGVKRVAPVRTQRFIFQPSSVK